MKRETNGLIIASWILFIVGLVFWGWLFPIIGAVFAHFGSVAKPNKNTPLIANVVLAVVIFLSYVILF